MRLALILAVMFFAVPAFADDEVRLDHKGMSAMDMSADQEDISTNALSDMGDDSGSGDLAIKIERGGFAGDDDADNNIGGNGPLSRDGGFNFGPAN